MVQSFQDAVAAADGLKHGDQQVLNLTGCDTTLREKIKDFMCGVNYSQEGTWEELGENVYLLAPPNAMVDVAPATPRVTAAKN
jgi:cell division inhibitor SepF